MDPALRALNGFGLGARLRERRALTDPRGWLHAQLMGPAPVLAAPPEASAAAIAEAIAGFRSLRQVPDSDRARARQEGRQRLLGIATAEARAALGARILSERPFAERLVAFWSNHLCVSVAGKVLVAPLAGSYEREVIRPHVFGRFEDLVLASARHPAMLIYLDNVQSIGPASPGARLSERRGGQRRGLNENYARELLELHTLGVDGGYTQRDVQELARALTGWTVAGLGIGRRRVGEAGRAAAGFQFVPLLHEPGDKTILGTVYREAGAEEAERAIRALCRHPSTATHLATKLVRHVVSDDPPASAVARVARVFRETDGDLRAVAGALVELPESWHPQTRKLRTPQEWLVAVLRAAGVREAPAATAPLLRQLRQPIWAPPSPKGFGDTARDWSDPDALLNRAELARTLARVMRGIDPHELLEVADVPPGDPLRALVTEHSIAADERVALVLAGPAFQWR